MILSEGLKKVEGTLGEWGRRREEIKKKTKPNTTEHSTKPNTKTNQPLMKVEGNKKNGDEPE